MADGAEIVAKYLDRLFTKIRLSSIHFYNQDYLFDSTTIVVITPRFYPYVYRYWCLSLWIQYRRHLAFTYLLLT